MDPNQVINLNQNAAQCIQSANSIGYTTYVNICSGTTQVVHWGSGDWLVAGFIGFIGLLVVGFIVFVLLAMLNDFF